jgi:hypothetical protein
MFSTRSTTRVLLLLIAGLLLAPTLVNAAAPQTKADHIAIAEKYEKMAADQQAVAQEHTTMLKEYKANAHRYPKQVREKWIAEMNRHCKAIIRDAKKLAADYEAIAKWHRTAAAQIEE